MLGTPLIQICYNGLSPQEQGIVLVPAVLYQGLQIVFGQMSVYIIHNWRLRTLASAEGTLAIDPEKIPVPRGQSNTRSASHEH